MLAILDYGAGNQTSVQRALEARHIESLITADPGELRGAAGVIFPGVGAARQAMDRLRDTGLDRVLKELVAENKPLLGICLGCQILLEHSEEEDTPCLGVLPGRCLRFQEDWRDGEEKIRIPHMGWNSVTINAGAGEAARIFDGIDLKDLGAQFYFVHGYYPCPEEDLILARTEYGVSFASLYGRPGLWAAQFHPEKSGEPGLRLLENFHNYCLESGHV